VHTWASRQSDANCGAGVAEEAAAQLVPHLRAIGPVAVGCRYERTLLLHAAQTGRGAAHADLHNRQNLLAALHFFICYVKKNFFKILKIS
jgi:hypothetical protein